MVVVVVVFVVVFVIVVVEVFAIEPISQSVSQ